MKFKAIRKEVKAHSSVSNDTVVTLKLECYSPEVLDLGKDEAETVYDVEIKKEEV